MSEPILVADHDGGLAARIADALRARTVEDALRGAEERAGVVAVVHHAFPPEGGISLAVRLARRGARPVLAETPLEPATLAAALRAGAKAILDPGVADASLRHALAAAAHGEVFLTRRALATLVAGDAAIRDPFPALTDRERAVLELLAAEVDPSAALGVTRKTVRDHVLAITSKLGLPDADAAARVARQVGLSA